MALENLQILTIGVDLGGTSLRVGAYAPGIGLLKAVTRPTRVDAGPLSVVEDMCAVTFTLLDECQGNRKLVGIGIGSPGPLELPAGRLHHPPNLPGWDGFPLLKELRQRLPAPVILESDANAAALAEYALGLGNQLQIDSLCMLTLGTGVGSGIVLNGKLWHGAAGMGGEAGHMTIYPNGPLCGCGNHGCLESCASATAMVSAAHNLVASKKSPGLERRKERGALETALDLASAARDGDPDAGTLYAETGRAIGICLAGLINILNLPLYVVGGGVANSWELLAPSLFEELEKRSYVYALTAPGRPAAAAMPGGGTQVLPARLGPEAGLLGACILPFYSQESATAHA